MTNQTDRLNSALAGRYRIERHLGEGGMASVYLCEDLKDVGKQPVWAPDGRHIYYVASDDRLMVATVATAPTLGVTSRQAGFEGTYDYRNSVVHAMYDAAPDGKHLPLVRPTNTVPQLVMVHDWKYELRERMAPSPRQ